ncbi:MAG: hypothetical protein FWF22_01235, partial [Treponema sp.]|nr:hypothetical protein [Treponema sp.]
MHVLRSTRRSELSRSARRIFKNLFFPALAFFILFSVYAEEELPVPKTGDSGSELLSMDLADSSVSLQIFGSWKGTLSAGWGIALTPFGNSALAGDTPLFMQEADLTLSLWIRNRWFVEGSFLDDYNLNTYRAGYQGQDGEIVQYAGIGNTGLDFPSFPYLDLGEASPSSFGFYGRFGSQDFSVHSLIRYDSAAREERIFTEGRERSYSYADITAPVRGISFVLPDSNLSSVPVVYMEDQNGPITDNLGRRWRQAQSSEYTASAVNGILELSLGTYTGGSIEPDTMIAVVYSVGSDNSPWAASLGNYGDPNGTGFLGKVQEYFDDSGRAFSLAEFPQCGGNYPAASAVNGAGPGQVILDGIPALVIYEKGSFSPFERQSQYNIGVVSGNDNSSAVSIVTLSTGTVASGFDMAPADDSSGMIYRLIRGTFSNTRDEKERWPLADAYPELYLPGKQIFTGDIGIRVTGYTAVDAFYIGTDVVPGSVQVMRDGLADPEFSYSPSSGNVTLRNPPFFNEIIRISYLKRSEDSRAGSIAAGVGILWNPAEHFSSGIGIGLRWNLSGEAFSEQGISSPGTAGLGAQADWNYSNFRAGITVGLGFEQPDTTGLYRAAGMEGNDLVLGLPPAQSFISPPPAGFYLAERASLVYRNYRDVSILGNSVLGNIESQAPVISNQTGPYPAMDSAFTSGGSIQILAAEFELNADNNWTGFEIPLGQDGSLLERAKEIDVPFRFLNMGGAVEKIQVFFQAGSLAGKDQLTPENPQLLIERSLYPDPLHPLPDPEYPPSYQGQRTVRINLTDEDRMKLGSAAYVRIIITASLDNSETVSGRVILAPPVIKGAGFRPVIIKNNEILPSGDTLTGPDNAAVMETIDSGTERLQDKYSQIMGRLNRDSGINRILEAAWELMENGTGAGGDQRIANLPLGNYRSLSFFVRRPKANQNGFQSDLDQGNLRFILGNGPDSFNDPGGTILDAVIPLKAFDKTSVNVNAGQWAKITLQYQGSGKGICIDNIPVSDFPGASLAYNDNLNGADSVWLAFLVMPGSSPLPDGGMAIDEVILEDPVPSFRLNASGSVDWNLPGVLISAGNVAVLSDLAVSAAAETGTGGNPFEQGTDSSLGMNGRTRAEFSLLGIRVTGNYSYTLQSQSNLTQAGYAWRAGHSISKAWQFFSLGESFDLDPSGAMGHRVNAAVLAPVLFSVNGNLSYRDDRYDRNWQAGIGWPANTGGRGIPVSLSLNANANWTEKSGTVRGIENYASAWFYSWEPLMPNIGSNALRRGGTSGFTFNLTTLPLGFRLYTEANSAYSGIDKTALSGTLARVDFPLTIDSSRGTWRFLFRQEREFRQNLFYGSRDFADDLGLYGTSLANSMPLMFSIPFYSFFDPNLKDSLKYSGLPDSAFLNSGRFSDRFEFSLQMPANYTVSSLFIPSRIALRMNRLLDRRMDVLRDT